MKCSELIVCLVLAAIFFLLSLFIAKISAEPDYPYSAEGVIRSVIDSDSNGSVCYRISFTDASGQPAEAESCYYPSSCRIIHEGTQVRFRYRYTGYRYPRAVIDEPVMGPGNRNTGGAVTAVRIISAGFVLLGIALFIKSNFIH